MTFVPSPDVEVRAALPDYLNRMVLCPDLDLKAVAKSLGVDEAELREKVSHFRGM
jgi:hypothetical protein